MVLIGRSRSLYQRRQCNGDPGGNVLSVDHVCYHNNRERRHRRARVSCSNTLARLA